MRIEKRKRGVARERDALSGRRDRSRGVVAGREDKRSRERIDPGNVDVRDDRVGDVVEALVQRFEFAGLDEAEMTLRQGERVEPRDRADDLHAERLDRAPGEPPMPRAADAVEHDPDHVDAGIVAHAALDHRRRRLRLPRDVDHQEHGQAQRGRDVGRGARAAGFAGHAVEQAHRGLAQHQLASRRRLAGERYDEFARHRPGMRLTLGAPLAAA